MSSNDSYLSHYVVKDHPEWTVIADLDESEAYEVDITEIYRTPAGYALVTASGCSCWGGEYDADEFDTLDALAAAVTSKESDERKYNPSYRALTDLLGRARAAA